MRNHGSSVRTFCSMGLRAPITAGALATLGMLATGCSTTLYTYVPTTNQTSQVMGQPAADYPIPPSAPRGDVQIASSGLEALHANDDPNHDIAAVHLRVIVSNSSDHEWRFNTMAQSLSITGHGNSAPAFATADKGSQPPLVTIAPMSKRTIDLFFPLPRDMQDADEVPAFDALWSLDTEAAGGGLISERTPFQRYEVDSDDVAPVPADYYAYGYGGPYWINPYYGYYGFYGAVVFAPRFYGHGVYVHRAPYGWHGGPGGFHGGGGYHGGGHGGGGHGGGHR